MQTALAIFGGIIAGLGLILVLPIILPIFGAFAGLIVGWVFADTSREFLAAIGLGNLAMWQVGAMLAFCGSFFKPSTTVNKG